MFIFVVIIALLYKCNDSSIQTISKEKDFIKWAEFNVPYDALERSYNCDINSEGEISWIDLLAVLGAKYGGDWNHYKSKDMAGLIEKANEENVEEIGQKLKTYPYFKEVYQAVLGEFLGTYTTETLDSQLSEIVWDQKYGLKVFSPIAKGYYFNHYDDFGSSRSYGYKRRHLGHDLMGNVGTPIIAVESGTVEVMGWNQYGGWRIGIRSYDKKRYYYYAHLRKNHPYNVDIYEGKDVVAGEVIGYLGRTGYSAKENVNNINTAHLHYGLELVFDESQKESCNEIWIDLYSITKLLEKHKSSVQKIEGTKEYCRKFQYIDSLNYLR